jgi:hypothetical protein
MKNTLLFTIVSCLLLFSCDSDENTVTLTQEELIEISSKLAMLETTALDTFDVELDTDSSSLFSKKGKSNNQSCQHEETYTETFEGFTTEITYNYFDANMDEITNCDTESSMETSGYYLFTEQKTTGNNREYNLFSETKLGLKMTLTSIESTNNSDIYGTLKIEDNVFNILDGSYFNVLIKMNLDIDISSLDALFDNIEVNGVYKIGFDANEDSYRFDMKLDSSMLNEMEETTTYTATYVLYNSSNSQVGFVKYIEDSETGLERFELYDLNEQLVEQSK